MNFWTQTEHEGAAGPLRLLHPRDGARFARAATINGVGWVADVSALTSVEIALDGRAVAQGVFGLQAEDVARLGCTAPAGEGVGFVFSLPAALALGEAVVLEVRAATGHGLLLHFTRLEVEPDDALPPADAWAALRPAPRLLVAHAGRPILARGALGFGETQEILDWEWHVAPMQEDATAAGAASGIASTAGAPVRIMMEEAALLEDGTVAVKGWAFSDAGAVSVAVALDGTELGTLVPDELRADVGRAHPGVPGAGHSGFRLARRLGERISGSHDLHLLARDALGREAQVEHRLMAVPGGAVPEAMAEQPVAAEPGIRAFLDQPLLREGRTVGALQGSLTVEGWAYAPAGIAGIEVFVDGVSQGPAYYGTRREDVVSAFADCTTPRPGFAMVLPPEAMRPGLRSVRVEITAQDGARETFSFEAEMVAATAGAGPWALRRRLTRAEIDLKRGLIARRGTAPAWCVVIPVIEVDSALVKTLDGLLAQAWDGWRAVLAVSAPALRAEVLSLLTGMADGDPRLGVRVAGDGARLADLAGDADWALLLPQGDSLGEDALLELSLAATGEVDFIYADERRRDPADGAVKAFFKPGFSPDLLLATNYIGRCWAARPALLARAGVTLGELAAHGDWDAALRLSEAAGGVAHVARVLSARGPERSRPALARVRQDIAALGRALSRRGQRAEVAPGAVPGSYRLLRQPPARACVSIVIPTAGARGMVETSLRRLREVTAWTNYEIICLDHIADADAEARRLKAAVRSLADVVLEISGPFNWSRFNNAAAGLARGDYLLFLNDDIEVDDPDWLATLLAQAQRPEIGVVGPRLLYPDGRVQHGGMFLAARAARHAFRMLPGEAPGAFGLARIGREVISVTGACMLMRREVFAALGGFDERHAVINNDLDFNLRVRQAGWRVLYAPEVSLLHHEMVSRAALPDSFDAAGFAAKWGNLFSLGDPYHNPNLSREVDDYAANSEPVLVETAGRPLAGREEIRRILVVKLDHLGDFVTTFPALRRLRAHFPAAEIVVLAAPASRAWAKLEPAIDRLLTFDFFHARSAKGRRRLGRTEMAELEALLTAERFDLALDLRRHGETREVLQVCGARWRAGFDRGHAHVWLDVALEFEGDIARQRKRSHVSDAMLRLVDAVAEQFSDDRAVVRSRPAQAAGRRALRRLTGADGAVLVTPRRRLVCVHPGAGAPNKQWPLESFAGLIDALAADGHAIAVIGGADEARLVNRLMRLVQRRQAVINLVGRVGLAALPEILGGMDLFVGNDSGPKHLAAGLGVPTIGIHSGTVDAAEWGAVGAQALTIRRDTVCSPCYFADIRDCHRGLACLTGIAVSDVYRACRQMLGE